MADTDNSGLAGGKNSSVTKAGKGRMLTKEDYERMGIIETGNKKVRANKDIENEKGDLDPYEEFESYEISSTSISPFDISKLVWNTWAEKWTHQRSYDPVGTKTNFLEGNREYRLALDLSALKYGPESGVLGSNLGKRLQREMKEWLKDESLPSVDLYIRLLYDPAYFHTNNSLDSEKGRMTRKLTINLEKIREAKNNGISYPENENTLQTLKQKGNETDFVFGSVDFWLKTQKELPEGPASIAFSFWQENGRPVDEISLGLCTKPQNCKGLQQIQYGFGGIDSIRTALMGKIGLPDAAIHFLELANGMVFGVLRWNLKRDSTIPELIAWPLEGSGQQLANELSRITKKLLKSKNENVRLTNGRALYNLLFPLDPEDRFPDRIIARKTFEGYIKNKIGKRKPFDLEVPPSIFVRLVANNITPPTLIPLGMMTIKNSQSRDDFLGNYFRIETPLPKQFYGAEFPCLNNWVMVQPSEAEGALNDALKIVGPRVEDPKTKLAKYRIIEGKSFANKFFEKFSGFIEWISNPDKLDPDREKPTLISILSHHDEKKLYFSDDDSLDYLNIEREFKQPSAVILNGCGTGQPGASQMIRRFNKFGIQAAVVTNAEVPGNLAGDYLECFISQMKGISEVGVTLSLAHHKTLHCLYQKGKGSKYGGMIFWYSLLGNGNLKVCPP